MTVPTVLTVLTGLINILASMKPNHDSVGSEGGRGRETLQARHRCKDKGTRNMKYTHTEFKNVIWQVAPALLVPKLPVGTRLEGVPPTSHGCWYIQFPATRCQNLGRNRGGCCILHPMLGKSRSSTLSQCVLPKTGSQTYRKGRVS